MNMPLSYILNQQIEKNGKNLLDSINAAKKRSSSNIHSEGKKRKKKPTRPQSTHFLNHPVSSNEATKVALKKKFHAELMKNNFQKEGNNLIVYEHQMHRHNKSLNNENMAVIPNLDSDLNQAQIVLQNQS